MSRDQDAKHTKKSVSLGSSSDSFGEWCFRLFYSEKVRSVFLQILCLLVFCGITAMFIYNASVNLKIQGTATGFAFLGERSGFAINQLPINYSEDSTFFRAFLVGLVNTIIVSGLGIILATLLGFFVAICRLSSNFLLSKTAVVFIETLRNLPLLLQILFWYFVVVEVLPDIQNSMAVGSAIFINKRGFYMPSLVYEPGSLALMICVLVVCSSFFMYRVIVNRHQQLTGVRWPFWPYLLSSAVVLISAFFVTGQPLSLQFPVLKGFNFAGGMVLSPEFCALFISLSFYTASFIAEIVRAGIVAVPKGQSEAARALGLKRSTVLSKVVVPQAMRLIVPPLTSQYLNLTKNSSLATAIGYPELVHVFAGTVLNQTGQAVEVLALTMAVYLTLSLTMSLVMNIYNRRIQLTQR